MDPKLRILKMVSLKKITAEEAEKLLSALEEGTKPKNLAIHVEKEGKKVNIKIPISFAKFWLKFIPDHVIEEKTGMSRRELSQLIEGIKPQKIVDVQDGEKKVEIYIY